MLDLSRRPVVLLCPQAWKQAREKSIGQKNVRSNVPALPGGSSTGSYVGGAAGGAGSAGRAGSAGGGGGGGGGGGAGSALLKQMVAQGYTVEEIMQLAKSRPELAKILFSK